MTPPEISAFLQAARDYVTQAVGVEIDGSETSLAFVDHYIASASGEPGLRPEILELVAPALGAYFGELAIAKFGGRWRLPPAPGGGQPEPARWRVELAPVELSFHPVGMAAAALSGGEVEGYDACFRTSPRWSGQLEEALAAMPPVDEAYFNSLTGRLETMAHAVDVLTELKRLEEADEQA